MQMFSRVLITRHMHSCTIMRINLPRLMFACACTSRCIDSAAVARMIDKVNWKWTRTEGKETEGWNRFWRSKKRLNYRDERKMNSEAKRAKKKINVSMILLLLFYFRIIFFFLLFVQHFSSPVIVFNEVNAIWARAHSRSHTERILSKVHVSEVHRTVCVHRRCRRRGRRRGRRSSVARIISPYHPMQLTGIVNKKEKPSAKKKVQRNRTPHDHRFVVCRKLSKHEFYFFFCLFFSFFHFETFGITRQ